MIEKVFFGEDLPILGMIYGNKLLTHVQRSETAAV
jgi:hypothetical protein